MSAHNTQLEKKIGEKMDMVPILNQVPHNPAHLLNTTHESGPDAAKDTASKELRVYWRGQLSGQTQHELDKYGWSGIYAEPGQMHKVRYGEWWLGNTSHEKTV